MSTEIADILTNTMATIEGITPNDRKEWTFRRVPSDTSLDDLVKAAPTTSVNRRFEVIPGDGSPGDRWGTGRRLMQRTIMVRIAYVRYDSMTATRIASEDEDDIISALDNIANIGTVMSTRTFVSSNRLDIRLKVPIKEISFKVNYYVNYA